MCDIHCYTNSKKTKKCELNLHKIPVWHIRPITI